VQHPLTGLRKGGESLEGFERSSQPTAMALVVLLGSRKRRRRRLTVDSWADVRLLRHTLPCSAA